jgi:hypothetical protein
VKYVLCPLVSVFIWSACDVEDVLYVYVLLKHVRILCQGIFLLIMITYYLTFI